MIGSLRIAHRGQANSAGATMFRGSRLRRYGVVEQLLPRRPSPADAFFSPERMVTSQPDIPRTHTVKPIDPPPDSDNPTTAMLKADIDSGRTGDKNPVYDPGLSQLGTDDEAAGRPPGPFRIALARHLETVSRWRRGARRTGAAHTKRDGIPVVFIGFIVAVGVILAVGIALA